MFRGAGRLKKVRPLLKRPCGSGLALGNPVQLGGVVLSEKQPPYDTLRRESSFPDPTAFHGAGQKYRVHPASERQFKNWLASEILAGFQFRSMPGFTPDGNPQRKFSIYQFPDYPSLKFRLKAWDLTAAGHHFAREKFEQCLDQCDSTFEPEPLKVDERCFVERLGDHHTDIRVVRHLVPNPTTI